MWTTISATIYPRKVLTVGLSSGSWAQVVANHPDVQSGQIIEINPGYLPIIPEYPMVRSLQESEGAHYDR